MTFDERLEFLTQSTESLHASCQELHAAVARQAEESARQAAESLDKEWRHLHLSLLLGAEKPGENLRKTPSGATQICPKSAAPFLSALSSAVPRS